jgi:hypothetical protein
MYTKRFAPPHSMKGELFSSFDDKNFLCNCKYCYVFKNTNDTTKIDEQLKLYAHYLCKKALLLFSFL